VGQAASSFNVTALAAVAVGEAAGRGQNRCQKVASTSVKVDACMSVLVSALALPAYWLSIFTLGSLSSTMFWRL
jgi:hypothetical protein